MLYEAALGLGIASGPLVGGFLGGISWRGPFFGVAVLMAIAFTAIAVLLERTPAPAQKVSLSAPIRALRHRGLLATGIVALFYNFGFFTLLAYTPFPLELGAHELGYVFFGWGLLVAIFSVFVAPAAKRRLGDRRRRSPRCSGLFAADLLVMAIWIDSQAVLIACVIAAGALIGVVNTVLTEAVMKVSPVERPVATSAYSFLRFGGGAIAPWLAGRLAEDVAPDAPYLLGAAAVAVRSGSCSRCAGRSTSPMSCQRRRRPRSSPRSTRRPPQRRSPAPPPGWRPRAGARTSRSCTCSRPT